MAQPAAGAWAEEVAAIAADSGLAILYGYPERVGDQVFNSAQLIDRDGRVLANYRKSHLYGELDTSTFEPGAGDFAIVGLDGVNVGILICYDVEFPEAVRALALAGADVVAVPTALMRPYEIVARTARAGARLREPGVRRLREPLRPGGRAGVLRRELCGRPRRGRPRPCRLR